MHINLIIGLVFILAVWWLLREARARKKAKAEPADMLKNELKKRQEAQEQKQRAADRLASLKNEHLSKMMEAVEQMRDALKSNSGQSLSAMREEDGISLAVRSCENTGKTRATPSGANGSGHAASECEDIFYLEWNVRNFDLEVFSGTGSLRHVQGDYIIRMPDGSIVREKDFPGFMRAISGLIADRLA